MISYRVMAAQPRSRTRRSMNGIRYGEFTKKNGMTLLTGLTKITRPTSMTQENMVTTIPIMITIFGRGTMVTKNIDGTHST